MGIELELDLNKTLEQNADDYFNKAKKVRKKIERTKHVIKQFEAKQIKLEKTKEKKEKKEIVKKEWYEKFRWFISSEGFLCIGGKDATTNEIVVKKHTDKEKDYVAHTEMPGSPFFVIKTEGKTPGDATKEELATAAASYSRAWKLGVAYTEVFVVKANQVKKEVSLPKGSFMVSGKREKYKPALELGIGLLKDRRVMGAPISACEKNCEVFVIIKQGKNKKSDAAKQIEKKLGLKNRLDDVLRVLPSGNIDVIKVRKK